MLNRRTFLESTLLSGLGLTVGKSATAFETNDTPDARKNLTLSAEELVTDEKYWKQVRACFNVPTNFINLENGYFSPQPKTTLAYHQSRENYINTNTSWFMRREQNQAIETSREALAGFLGCPTQELAITRNTTESLNTLISGYPWKAGDEVVIGNQDYGSMVSAFHQAAKRFGIVVKVAQVPLNPVSADEVIMAYAKLFSTKTRLVHLTHLINLSGQVIPVAAIATIAKRAGAEVAVDSAHAVAHLKFSIPDLQADYVGASLHKWMCNPLGAGFLWMKKEHIVKIYPLTADEDFAANDIRKFEHQGTRPIQTLETLVESIKFHNNIGSELKQNRLRFLMRYWVNKATALPKIKINTPYSNDSQCGAIANISVEGFTPTELSEKLLMDYKIFTVSINHPAIKGVRITPHIYNNLDELDKLVGALREIAK